VSWGRRGAYLERAGLAENEDLKGLSWLDGHAAVAVLAAPAVGRQGVPDDAALVEAHGQVQGDVRFRVHRRAALQVHVEALGVEGDAATHADHLPRHQGPVQAGHQRNVLQTAVLSLKHNRCSSRFTVSLIIDYFYTEVQ